ncbi:16S rRNA (cytidine(1402)-2'-O)-methyltransferase [candidate division WWE3 bacterium RIFCSPLOWO2_01_FULL_42_11]|uniref:Ribosomal RNA small subunit methyltransferase I n=1 Tax=candidate division WWE3 bacterium RIFCSPLOWO2_01_FULL_42_11 TaxID=1802627 RepID=A0A1F4VNG0_UNCKA|nr:MAG: 16S rRNA (cytidine(1402)-2'-O)-methyltransferase [candidate division WWE3 bacterium RIFCSPLOWO2_01_FULL_42_11]
MDPKNIITPGLYLIPTPIGNLADMTLRAIDVLKQLNVLYCEDTRTSGVLLKSYDIRIPKLSILNDHNESQKVTEITDLIKSDQMVGIMSDAGTPLMNDPGYKIVRGTIDADLPVISLPGASSVTTALVASGLPVHEYLFIGFLPPKSGKRVHELESLKPIMVGRGLSVVAFESPHRILHTLKDLESVFGSGLSCALCIELTKKFERIVRGTPTGLLDQLGKGKVKGEIVLVMSVSS